MTRTFIDIHVLQTVPPSNMNRDDTGSPKTAVYGGVRRARVSSQSWKRATRLDFQRTLDGHELGVRTKRVVELVVEEIARQADDVDLEAGAKAAAVVLGAAGIKLQPARKKDAPDESGYLILLSRLQIEALAAIAVESVRTGNKPERATALAVVKDKNSVDLALFGRMVADVTDLNVDAAAQVAHAISVHPVETEYDYFTAVDDHKREDAEEDAGAGMIGTVEFSSSTMYRYATVDVAQLAKNLGDPVAVRRGVEAFVRSFVRSLPTGKQNTFANRTLPDAVVVVVRHDQPVNLVGAFESPVSSDGSGTVEAAARALAAYAQDIGEAYGDSPVQSWVVGVGARTSALDSLGERISFDALVPAVGEVVAARLAPVP